MENIVIFMILSVFLELFYFVYEDKIKHLLIYLYGIITSENGIYYSIVLSEFLVALGPSITAVSVVGMFIPIKDVSELIIVFVFFVGISTTLLGAYIKKVLKET